MIRRGKKENRTSISTVTKDNKDGRVVIKGRAAFDTMFKMGCEHLCLMGKFLV